MHASDGCAGSKRRCSQKGGSSKGCSSVYSRGHTLLVERRRRLAKLCMMNKAISLLRRVGWMLASNGCILHRIGWIVQVISSVGRNWRVVEFHSFSSPHCAVAEACCIAWWHATICWGGDQMGSNFHSHTGKWTHTRSTIWVADGFLRRLSG